MREVQVRRNRLHWWRKLSSDNRVLYKGTKYFEIYCSATPHLSERLFQQPGNSRFQFVPTYKMLTVLTVLTVLKMLTKLIRLRKLSFF